MSRHSFALSVLLCSLASLLCIAPVRGQLLTAARPADVLSPLARPAFHCVVFEYDAYDYSDYDYNDYSYDTDSATGGEPDAGAQPEGPTSDAQSEGEVAETAAPVAASVAPDATKHFYGCGGYCYDDDDLYPAEAARTAAPPESPAQPTRDKASEAENCDDHTCDEYTYDEYTYDEHGYHEYGYDAYGYDAYGYDAYGYDEYGYDAYAADDCYAGCIEASRRSRSAADPAEQADRAEQADAGVQHATEAPASEQLDDLLTGYDAVYDSAVYGPQPADRAADAQPPAQVACDVIEEAVATGERYETFYFGVPCQAGIINDHCLGLPGWGGCESQPEAAAMDPQVTRVVRRSAEAVGRQVAALAERICQAELAPPVARVVLRRPPTGKLPHAPKWSYQEYLPDGSTFWTQAARSPAQIDHRTVMLEAAETLEGLSSALSTAARHIRDRAREEDIYWRGIPYRR